MDLELKDILQTGPHCNLQSISETKILANSVQSAYLQLCATHCGMWKAAAQLKIELHRGEDLFAAREKFMSS